MKTRVLVVDDHPLMRDALRSAIDDEDDLTVVGEAVNGAEAVRLADTLRPNVIVMDLYLPVKDGLTATAEIVRLRPATRILALTSSTEDGKVLEAIQAGAVGFLLKDTKRTELLEAIREVARGHTWLPPSAAQKLVIGLRRERERPSIRVEPLTEREREVVKLIGEGATNRDIAERLTISEGTVRTHVHNILGKLELESRNQLILYALKGPGADRK